MEIAGVPKPAARAKQLLEEVGLVRPRPPLSVAALRRRAAAGRHRPGARQQPAHPARRRAHRKSRQRHRPSVIELLLDVNRTRQTTLVLVTHDRSSRRSRTWSSRCATGASCARRRGRRRRRPRDVRPQDARPRAPFLLAAAAVLLRLRGGRRRRDRRAALGDPERSHRPDARGPLDHRLGRPRSAPTGRGRAKCCAPLDKRLRDRRRCSSAWRRSRPRRWCERKRARTRRGWWSCAACSRNSRSTARVVLQDGQTVLARSAARPRRAGAAGAADAARHRRSAGG